MIFSNVYDIVLDDIILELCDFLPGVRTFLKLEGLNPAGSIKLKTAIALVERAERRGRIGPRSRLIESSSGNLGIAMSMVCASKGYPLTVVTDPNANRLSIQLIETMGAEVVEVTSRDANGGFLGTRIKYIIDRLACEPELVWLNQYDNPANPRVHQKQTARSLHKELGSIDALFVGVGTSGTAMGCVEYFRIYSPQTQIFAVDSVGSVTLGGRPGIRRIPGLGSSRTPEIFRDSGYFTKVLIQETDAINMCRQVARNHGLLIGGSTGTVLAAVAQARGALARASRVAVISLISATGILQLFTQTRGLKPTTQNGNVSQPPPNLHAEDGLSVVSHIEEAFEVHATRGNIMIDFHVVPGAAVDDILAGSTRQIHKIVAETYLAHERGRTVNPSSYFLYFPEKPDSRVIALPAYLDSAVNMIGLKWISSFPCNIASGLPRASAVLILNDYTTGYSVACLEAAGISAARTAASAALAAYTLAGPGPCSAGFVGAGVIARTILDHLCDIGVELTELRCCDLDATSADHLVAYAKRRRLPAACAATLAESLQADLVVLATTAATQYIAADTPLRPGQLILNISLRDLAPELLLDANNIVDDIEHCLKANTAPHLAERLTGSRSFITGTLGAALAGRITLDPGRPTIFSPFGLGVLDIAVGAYVLGQAQHRGCAIAIPNFFGTSRRW
jgi:cysteine synthase A